jgi:hypothetical protein
MGSSGGRYRSSDRRYHLSWTTWQLRRASVRGGRYRPRWSQVGRYRLGVNVRTTTLSLGAAGGSDTMAFDWSI